MSINPDTLDIQRAFFDLEHGLELSRLADFSYLSHGEALLHAPRLLASALTTPNTTPTTLTTPPSSPPPSPHPSGAFALVYRARLQSADGATYTTVAVKVLKPDHHHKPSVYKRFLQEVAVHPKLQHKCASHLPPHLTPSPRLPQLPVKSDRGAGWV